VVTCSSSWTQARGTYNGGTKKLTFAVPSGVSKGDLLVALVVRDTVTDLPAGWQTIETIGVSPVILDVQARLVQDNEPETVTFTTAVSHEMQGILVHLRGSTPAQLREASASAGFAATMAPQAPASTTQQAISWMLGVWSSSGVAGVHRAGGIHRDRHVHHRGDRIALSPVRVSRREPDGQRRSRGRGDQHQRERPGFTLTWRDRQPITPAELYDPVPGNHGLMETTE
jgi:hypothetical protein